MFNLFKKRVIEEPISVINEPEVTEIVKSEPDPPSVQPEVSDENRKLFNDICNIFITESKLDNNNVIQNEYDHYIGNKLILIFNDERKINKITINCWEHRKFCGGYCTILFQNSNTEEENIIHFECDDDMIETHRRTIE
ncbi:MAG: hypothetical protein KDC67_15110, partial [Ignavibacteriae bacterium]|nr:hypothetical protein [Ignavibacteriota bacterium]